MACKDELKHDYKKAFEVFKDTMREGDYLLAVKSALEKQIAKKPTPQVVKGGKRLIGNGWWCNGTTVYKCPCCNSWITLTYKYCIDCGQALDWGDCE